MRCFVAVEIPDAVRRQVAERIAFLRPALPAARWVPPDNYHLTLRFLGELDEGQRLGVEEALAPVFGRASALPVQMGEGGTFPPGRPARVAWIGLMNPRPLESLVEAVEKAIEAEVARHGGRRGREKYRPHLTVARCRTPWPRSAVSAWAAEVSDPLGDHFLISRAVLMSSTLGPDGARYDVQRVFPLEIG